MKGLPQTQMGGTSPRELEADRLGSHPFVSLEILVLGRPLGIFEKLSRKIVIIHRPLPRNPCSSMAWRSWVS